MSAINKQAWLYLKCLITLCTALCFNEAHAETEEDGRFWLNSNAQGALPAEHFNWYAELQPRWRDEGKHLDTVLIRPAVFYKFSPQSSVWLGYAKVINHPAGKQTRDEHRIWQQYLYQFSAFDTLNFQTRTRLEERRLEDSGDEGYRIRQMLRVSKPLLSQSAISLVAWDELFIHLNDTDWGAEKGFDQNRLFVGAAYTVNPQFKVEVGYLNQYIHTDKTDRENHTLATTLLLNF